MENNIVLKIVASMVFFLPLLLAFAGFAFIGALVLFEMASNFFTKKVEVAVEPVAVVHGPIATALSESIAEEAAQGQEVLPERVFGKK